MFARQFGKEGEKPAKPPRHRARLVKYLYACAAYALILIPGPFAAGQTSPYPRYSEAAARVAETAYFNELVNRLEAKKIKFSERPLMADYGAFGTSILVDIPARPGDGSDGLFVLAVPVLGVPLASLTYNGAEYRASGPGWSGELALGVLDKFLSEPPPFDTLVYFAADNWPAADGGGISYAGFQDLLAFSGGRGKTVIVYCDSGATDAADPVALAVLRGAGTGASPLALAEPLTRLCAEIGVPFVFDRGGGGPAAADLEAAADRRIIRVSGVPAARLSFAGHESPEAGKTLTPEVVAALFYRYAADILRGGTATDEADLNYAYIGFFGGGTYVTEPTLVLLALFGMVSVFVLCFLLASKPHYALIPVFACFLLATALFLFMLYRNGPRTFPARTETPGPRTLAVDTAERDRYFTAVMESERFLEHRIVRIGIEAHLPPLQYGLSFRDQSADDPDGKPPYFIYDAPMPYTAADGRIDFVLGSYPVNPLNIEIALPLNLTGEFRLEGLFPGNVISTKTFPVPAVHLPGVPGSHGL
ncbi:MAG: hypothetical protein LBO04_05985 [Spirochaetaceae bacterium]|jgi:hypothetical protein|nr:hypothetical protein [Spirochaetaceae bacterium]